MSEFLKKKILQEIHEQATSVAFAFRSQKIHLNTLKNKGYLLALMVPTFNIHGIFPFHKKKVLYIGNRFLRFFLIFMFFSF